MPHPHLSALRQTSLHPGDARVLRPASWPGEAAEAGVSTAVLITGCGDPAPVVRAYRTVLPAARVLFYGDDLGACVAAAAAGAEVRQIFGAGRDALVRRLFAEVDADAYVLAHRAGAADACVAPLALAEVGGGRDFVDVRRFGEPPNRDLADRLLCRTVDFAFGGWGDMLHSDLRACSRRFALSYRRTAPADGADAASHLRLPLHALRLRLPIGRVTTLADAISPSAPAPAGTAAGWAARAGIVARLLIEERPRRVFGLLGLALVTSGLMVLAPDLKAYRWRVTIMPGAEWLAAAALLAAGGLVGAAGLLFDALASARQEVARLGAAAIPHRAGRESPAPAESSTRGANSA